MSPKNQLFNKILIPGYNKNKSSAILELDDGFKSGTIKFRFRIDKRKQIRAYYKIAYEIFILKYGYVYFDLPEMLYMRNFIIKGIGSRSMIIIKKPLDYQEVKNLLIFPTLNDDEEQIGLIVIRLFQNNLIMDLTENSDYINAIQKEYKNNNFAVEWERIDV